MVDERIIIAQLRNGSEKAFNLAYDMYAMRLFAFCYTFVKSKDDAEEIVQEAFVKLWLNREQITNTDTLKPYLFTIVYRDIINMVRKRVKSVSFEDYVADVSAISENDSRIEYEQYLEVVEKSLSLLPPTQQSVVRMSRLEGLKNKEIAERLSLSEKTVKNQLSVGMKSVRYIVAKVLKIVIITFLSGFWDF